MVVNTDPLETSLVVTPPALTQTGLGGLANVTFLTGSLRDLSSVWKAYGVTVALSNTTRLVTHNDVMDFIDPRGRLALQATPFANENSFGVYSLDPATIHTFAQGVATAAAGLFRASHDRRTAPERRARSPTTPSPWRASSPRSRRSRSGTSAAGCW